MAESMADGPDIDAAIMDCCLVASREAGLAGNSPIAAAVVRGTEILAVAPNAIASNGDPTAHAEVEAIRAAARRLGTSDLTGCTLYSPLEPCPMCCGAMLAARISRLVLGARNARLGRRLYGAYRLEALLQMAESQITVTNGVREVECETIRRDWEAARHR